MSPLTNLAVQQPWPQGSCVSYYSRTSNSWIPTRVESYNASDGTYNLQVRAHADPDCIRARSKIGSCSQQKAMLGQPLAGANRQPRAGIGQASSVLLAPPAPPTYATYGSYSSNPFANLQTPLPYVGSAISTAASLPLQDFAVERQEATIEPIQHSGQESSADNVLVGVIVTISDGHSYDQLFSQVPQLAGENQRVATYRASVASLPHIVGELLGNPPQGSRPSSLHRNLRRVIADIRQVQPDSVVFNWECCSGCGSDRFHDARIVLELVKHLLDRGHMVMFSDFSLKALIAEWNENLLGPNPFLKVSEFGGTFQLRFDAEVLKVCSSAQLQKLGELASNGKADLHAMTNTIAFSINWNKADCNAYDCNVLTVMSKISGQRVGAQAPGQMCEAGGHQGLAGHVMLTFPSGGRLLASAGHWIELSRLDVNEADLIQAAASYGAAFQSEVQTSIAACKTNEERQRSIQAYSTQMIHQSAPCSYSRTR
jgi:hypothetical protein